MAVEAAENPAETRTPATAEPRSERSTIAFPYNDLQDAGNIAKAVNRVGGTTCQVEQLAAELGVVHNSGPFRLRLQAARIFGLLTYAQGTVSLTALGSKLCDPKQEPTARAEAFLIVPLYKRLYEKFKGGALPPTAGLEAEMVNLGVVVKQRDRARQAFQRSARHAGFFWAGSDRLVMPKGISASAVVEPLSDDERDEEEEQPARRRRRDDDDGGDGRHQLIAGLIRTLPPEGSEWGIDDRGKWLQAAATIFELIYKNTKDGRRSVSVRVEDSAK